MATRPQLFTRGLSGLAQSSSSNEISSPAEQRDDAKSNFFKSMRPLPTQHYWDVYFDRFVCLLEAKSLLLSSIESLANMKLLL
jgi:hypothetical protein